MTIDDYAAWASSIRATRSASDQEATELSYLGLGLAGECGEVVELIKKLLRDGKFDAEQLADELGDVAYYWARLCAVAGKSPTEILRNSRSKIQARLTAKSEGI